MSGSGWRKQTKARKSHWCEICRGEIVPGEVYVRYDCTPWGHPDNEGYHTYRNCRFCDHMHYDVLDIADEDGTPWWEETVLAIRGRFWEILRDAGILDREIDPDTYADDFSRWTLAGGPFERCVGHPEEELNWLGIRDRLRRWLGIRDRLRRCDKCAAAFRSRPKAGQHNPVEFYIASEWNAAQRFFRQYPRYLPEPISYEVAVDLLKERDYDLTDPERVKQVIGWFGDTDNVRRAIETVRGEQA